MNPADPNLQRVELVARALGDLCDELIFVGGCAAGMLCTSVQAPPPRATFDVDLVAEVTALAGYHALEARFAARGFTRDMSPDAPICRWRVGNVEVDLTFMRSTAPLMMKHAKGGIRARPSHPPLAGRLLICSLRSSIASRFERVVSR